MGKDPAMPLYVNDWFSSARVQAMTPAQELAYMRLCMFCWASGDASIPDDDELLASMSRMGKGWLNGGSTVVRKCFNQHPTKPQALTNNRVYELWKERQEWREKSRRGGVTSGQKRSGGKKLRNHFKGGSTVVEPKANLSSSSSSSSKDSEACASGVLFPDLKDQGGGDARGGGKPKPAADRSVEIRAVFDHYRSLHPRAFPSPTSGSKEWRLISARLGEGYSVDDLATAIDGNHRSPYHCGLNDRQREYHNLELIVRNGSMVQQFMDVPETPPTVMTEREMSNALAAQQFLQEGQSDDPF